MRPTHFGERQLAEPDLIRLKKLAAAATMRRLHAEEEERHARA